MEYLLIVLGIISLAVGILGIFLPLLPTTPFLLLSAFLFARSSEKLHSWLLNHKILGKYICDFLQDRTIPLRIKIISISSFGRQLFAVLFLSQTANYGCKSCFLPLPQALHFIF
jgi:uncharacterized membrane protein YbaN (DUF454 family)